MAKQKKRDKCWLYAPFCTDGQVFSGEEAIGAAIKEGWVESPADLKEEKPKKTRAKNASK